MPDIDHFSVDDLVEISAELRLLGRHRRTMVEAASDLTTYLYDRLTGCASVSIHKTHAYGDLPGTLTGAVSIQIAQLCLTPLASAGLRSPLGSLGPRPSPLDGREDPFTSELLATLTLDPDELRDLELAQQRQIHRRSLGVFCETTESLAPLLPREQIDTFRFYGVQSVLCIGGGLISGHVFILSLLCTVAVSGAAAATFRSIAPAVQAALVPMTYRVFG